MVHKTVTVSLEPKSIAACTELPSELAFMGQILHHQAEVFKKSIDNDIIVNSSATGTGKTKAAFTVLIHENNRNKNAIYIAPTNALVEQQKLAAEEFIKQAGLPHVVIAASAKDVRGWPNDKSGIRPGEKIYDLLRNPATIFPEVGADRPVLLITNPDSFYYATFFAYGRLDRVNIASQFYSHFATVIFDEFHLYDAKQLVGLLFYIAFSYEFGFFKNGRRVILLTATPEPACDSALKSLSRKGVKIAYIDGEASSERLLPSQTAVTLKIKPQPDRAKLIAEISNEVQRKFATDPDKYGAVILDSLDQINELALQLSNKGLKEVVGRITGPSLLVDRQRAAQCPIILATSTVDVGFNFERNLASERQTLDWIVFSSRDRASFWQRIGRVGRVLGRKETHIPSTALAYIPEQAWKEDIESLHIADGREKLRQKLAEIECLDRPFLATYWQSEALIEVAQPLVEIESRMKGLPESNLVSNLYETIRSVLGGKCDWKYYRKRVQALQAAREIVQKKSDQPIFGFIDNEAKWAIVTSFLKAECLEDWDDLKAKRTIFRDYENVLNTDDDARAAFKDFCKKFSVSYEPLFSFRSSLFESLNIQDPNGLLLDISEMTNLDPVHLLRYYEFTSDGAVIEVSERAEQPYQIKFRLRYYDSQLNWKADQLNKLRAFENCKIERRLNDILAPTPLIASLEKELIPGVMICPIANASAFYRTLKDRIISYPVTVLGRDFEKEYRFFPGLSGILALASYGTRLRLPDDDEFLCF